MNVPYYSIREFYRIEKDSIVVFSINRRSLVYKR